MAKLKAPTQIGGVAVDPRGASAGEGLVFDGAAFTPSPIDPGSGALFLPLSGGAMVGDIDMNGNEIQDVVLPGYLPLAGGTLTGHLIVDDDAFVKLFNTFGNQGGSIWAYPDTGREILVLSAGNATTLSSDPSILLYGMSDNSTPGEIQIRDSANAYVWRYDPTIPVQYFRTAGVEGMRIQGLDMWNSNHGRSWRLNGGPGAATTPVYSFRDDPNTGIYSNEADGIYITAGGVVAFGVAQGTVNSPLINTATTGTAANVNVGTTGLRILARFTSALKYKSDLTDADYLADIELKPQKFYRTDDDRYFYGFIADWLADQDTLIGTYGEDGDIENYDSPAVMAILAAKVNRLTERIEELEGSLNT